MTAARPAAGGLGALVAAGVLWGTGGPLGSLLSRATGLSMLAVADYRLLVGGTAIVAVLAAARHGLPRGAAAWRRIAVVGLLSAVFQSGYFTAIALTSVSLATMITIGATPVIVLVAEARSGSQRVTRRVLVTVLLALAGLGLLTGIPPGRIGLVQVVAGSAAALVSAAGFAAVTLLGARPVDGLDELTMTGTGFAIGGALLAPFAVLGGGLGFGPAPAAIGLVIALGVVPTAAAYLLYFRALRDASAGTAALLSLIEPLTATMLAVLFLGDRVNAATIGGGALLTSAVLLASASERDRNRRLRQPGR
ncbi:MAG: DMT family transporter [Streptosporangiaceae bacterium]